MDGSGKETETGVMRSASCMVLGLVWEGVDASTEGWGGGMMHVAESAGRAWENKKMGAPARLQSSQDPTLAWPCLGRIRPNDLKWKGMQKTPEHSPAL